MHITQDTKLQANPALSATVAEKDRLLESTVNGAAAQATWGLNGTEARPSLILQLRDKAGYQSSGTFAPYEFKSDVAMASRLGELSEALKRVAEWRKAVDALFEKIMPWCFALPG